MSAIPASSMPRRCAPSTHELEAEGRRRLAAASFAGPVQVQRSADMRYGEQIFEVNVGLDGIDWAAADLLAQLAAAFHRRHEELYTYAHAGPGGGAGQRPCRRDRRAA